MRLSDVTDKLLSPGMVFFIAVAVGVFFRYAGLSVMSDDVIVATLSESVLFIKLSNICLIFASFIAILRWMRRWSGVNWSSVSTRMFSEAKSSAIYMTGTYFTIGLLVAVGWAM